MTAPLEAALWREVARHDDIASTTAALLALLRAELDVDWLLVRSWDPERARLETIAAVDTHGTARLELPTPRRDALLAWAASGTVERWPSREVTGIARMIVPETQGGAIVAGPLVVHRRDANTFVGVLLVGTADPAAPALVARALEPFAVALQNDGRLHELARLREAAEQDRSALLARLARQDVSDAIIGSEHGLREVMARVTQVAPTDAPVLILGATGSGKEVVARAIHTRSRRGDGPFLRVNCGAIPTELVDSELFGHEKGSFTGAIAQRKGWFERADGGTLFLDEVAELPAAAQVRLLRVLQDGSFQRVGGQDSRTVDVRIVAATHRDLATMVRDGGFRQDLWYRISVFPILLPALRDRRGDIGALAQHFSERAGIRLFGRPLTVTAADVEQLAAYDWPGNVRELAAVIERAAILGGGHTLQIVPALGLMPAMAPRVVAPEGEDRTSVEAALRRCRGRIEGPFGAAAALGVNPHTLRSRMRKMGIAWETYRRE